MKIDGYWTFPRALAQYGGNLNYGVAVPPVPTTAANQSALSWVSGWCFAIPATARNKEGGWELLKFLAASARRKCSGKRSRLQLGTQGLVYVPTQNANRKINEWLSRNTSLATPPFREKVRDGVQLLNNLLDHSPIRPVTPVGQLLFNEQKRATENAIFHKLSPQAALDDANQTVHASLTAHLAHRAARSSPGNISSQFISRFSRLGQLLFTCGKQGRRAGIPQPLKAHAAGIFDRNGAGAGSALRPGSSALSP